MKKRTITLLATGIMTAFFAVFPLAQNANANDYDRVTPLEAAQKIVAKRLGNIRGTVSHNTERVFLTETQIERLKPQKVEWVQYDFDVILANVGNPEFQQIDGVSGVVGDGTGSGQPKNFTTGAARIVTSTIPLPPQAAADLRKEEPTMFINANEFPQSFEVDEFPVADEEPEVKLKPIVHLDGNGILQLGIDRMLTGSVPAARHFNSPASSSVVEDAPYRQSVTPHQFN